MICKEKYTYIGQERHHSGTAAGQGPHNIGVATDYKQTGSNACIIAYSYGFLSSSYSTLFRTIMSVIRANTNAVVTRTHL